MSTSLCRYNEPTSTHPTLQLQTGIQTTVRGVISVFEEAVKLTNDAIDVANKVPFVHVTPIDTSGLDQLKNFTLPTNLTADIENISNSIPTVAELKDKIESM